MKLKILLLVITLSPLFLNAQNLPACDSVFIDCCTFDAPTENTISIIVANYSSNIFSYPGFILFTEEMDTVAIETVNYYGIGWDQTHILDIIHPLTLPFEGILELHTGFYDTQVCSFPVTIPDSTLTQISEVDTQVVKVYPNPATHNLTLDNISYQNLKHVYICDLSGRIIKVLDNTNLNSIDVSRLKAGLYFINIVKANGDITRAKFVKE